MSHLRAIKLDFFLNDEIAELDPLVRLALIGLWMIADEEGFLEYRPKRLKAQIFPYDECDFESIVDTLAEDGFVFFCKDEMGETCIEINTFQNHPYFQVI